MKKWLTEPAGAGRSAARAAENFARNRAAFGESAGPLIHGQRTEPACSMYYGTHDMGWNGCELIAVCNVMNMLGRRTELPDVVHEFELNRMHFVFSSGYWGTAPRQLRRYFDAHGVSYRCDNSRDRFLKMAGSGRCGILSFWNNRRKGRLDLNFFSGGLHTVAYSVSGGRYYVYNLHSRDRAPYVTDDLMDILRGRRFIVGYVF